MIAMITPISEFVRQRRAPNWLRALAVAALAGGTVVGCNTFLDVDNPNNVPEDALTNPAAAPSIANGSGGAVTRALAAMLAPYSTASDELTWVGSRDAYKELDDGTPSNPSNEFTDAAFAYISEARYTADQAVTLLEGFDKDGSLPARADLARSYLYAAIIYVSIADMFDDFVISSSKREAGQPVGEQNMSTLYDVAIGYLDKGLAIAVAVNNTALRQQILAMRARAKFDKALWAKVNPVGQVPAQPLVNDAGAAADAQAALALIGAGNDFKFKLTPLTQTTGFPIVGNDLNNRVELRAGDGPLQVKCTNATCDRFIVPNSAGKQVASVKYVDPVNNTVDPVLTAAITECCIKGTQNGNGDLVPMTIVSAREMYLILAEVALAQGNTASFTTNINAIRAFNQGLQPYNGTTPAPRDMLIHERLVNLWLQGRRLTDMYRFGIKSQEWAANSIAATTPGCFLPISITERLSNSNVKPQTTCGLK
jgi:hypothetical protein